MNKRSAYDAGQGGAKVIREYLRNKKVKELETRKYPNSPYMPRTIPSYVRTF